MERENWIDKFSFSENRTNWVSRIIINNGQQVYFFHSICASCSNFKQVLCDPAFITCVLIHTVYLGGDPDAKNNYYQRLIK